MFQLFLHKCEKCWCFNIPSLHQMYTSTVFSFIGRSMALKFFDTGKPYNMGCPFRMSWVVGQLLAAAYTLPKLLAAAQPYWSAVGYCDKLWAELFWLL